MIAPRPARNGHPASAPAAQGTRPPANEAWAAAAAALAECAADLSAPLAEFGCGTGGGGAALARAGFTRIDGFDPSEANLAAAARRGVYRRLQRADIAAAGSIEPGVYANVAMMNRLDPAHMSPEVIDRMTSLLPPGGCVLFVLPGGGVSVGPFRTRILELCEYFIAEPVLRRPAPPSPRAGLQSTLYVLKKR